MLEQEQAYLESVKEELSEIIEPQNRAFIIKAESSIDYKEAVAKIYAKHGYFPAMVKNNEIIYLPKPDNMEISELISYELQAEIDKIFNFDAKGQAELQQKCKQALTKAIEDECGIDMTYEVSPVGYDDYISESTILQAFHEYVYMHIHEYEHFDSYLYEKISGTDIMWDADSRMINDIDNDMRERFGEVYEQLADENGINELFYDCGYVGMDIKLDEFLDHDYHFNLMFATPAEKNYDMGAIPDFFIDPDRFHVDDPEKDKRGDNALSYLIEQQGYSIEDVQAAYDKCLQSEDYTSLPSFDDRFIGSVASELYNYPDYGMAELTALVTMRGRKLLDVLDKIAHQDGNIEISADSYIGLYEEWQGAGSDLDIELAKEFIVPVSMIRSVQLEKAGKDLNHGYTVDTTYGLVGECWRGNCSVTDKPAYERTQSEKKKTPEVEK